MPASNTVNPHALRRIRNALYVHLNALDTGRTPCGLGYDETYEILAAVETELDSTDDNPVRVAQFVGATGLTQLQYGDPEDDNRVIIDVKTLLNKSLEPPEDETNG